MLPELPELAPLAPVAVFEESALPASPELPPLPPVPIAGSWLLADALPVSPDLVDEPAPVLPPSAHVDPWWRPCLFPWTFPVAVEVPPRLNGSSSRPWRHRSRSGCRSPSTPTRHRRCRRPRCYHRWWSRSCPPTHRCHRCRCHPSCPTSSWSSWHRCARSCPSCRRWHRPRRWRSAPCRRSPSCRRVHRSRWPCRGWPSWPTRCHPKSSWTTTWCAHLSAHGWSRAPRPVAATNGRRLPGRLPGQQARNLPRMLRSRRSVTRISCSS